MSFRLKLPSMLNKFGLIYWANKISLKKSAGQLERLSSLLAKSTIDLNPHQIYATIFALNSPLSRGAILADEVGLGKTIEAGIIISQLWLEGKKRILIIVPASLRTQWRDELETHFGISSTILDTPYFIRQINLGKPMPMTINGIYIASLPFVYKRIKLVKKQPWDLVLVDEAHKLRRVYRGRDASKMAFALRDAIQDKPKLFLTATPLQNNLMELYGLASFIDNKLLGTKYYFKTRFIEQIVGNPSKSNAALQILRRLVAGPEDQDFFSPSGVIVRTLRKQIKNYVKFPPRQSVTQDFTPTEQEQLLYNQVSDYLKRPRAAAIETTQRNLMILVYRKLLASSSFAISPTLEKLFKRLKKELELRKLEKEKQQLLQGIGKDELMDRVEDRDELEALEKELESKRRISNSFSDEEIKAEIEELENYYYLATSIKKNVKGEALVKALNSIFSLAQKKGWPKKAVVFTESRRTQKYLGDVLKNNKITYTLFNGSNMSEKAGKAYEAWKKEFPELALDISRKVAIRQALIHDFKTHSQVLLTTEAGAEGLNLQFCNIVVNYDLPWNPQRVEQRIGRCHRYGQNYEVIVANMLNTQNYADKRVLELMEQKLHLFNGLFGASDEILGALESGVDFEKRIVNIYQTCQTPQEIDKAFEKLQKEMQFHLNQQVKQMRSKIIEQFDAPILRLFKRTKTELTKVLSEYDEALFRLCKLYFGDKIRSTSSPGIYKITHKGETKEYLFREEKKNEIGKLSRAHTDHPLIKKILQRAKEISTSPIPTTLFYYSKSVAKIKELNKYLNKGGFIFLFKLMIKGVEEDEILTPLIFVKQNNCFIPLSYNTSCFIVELNSEQINETAKKSPISKKELLAEWEKWRKQAVQKFEKRNERLYIREEERIYRYWDSQALKTKDKIEKLVKEIKDLKRKRQNTIDFGKKRKFAQKVQKREMSLQRLKIQQTKIESEALREKGKDIDELNEKLKLNIEEELIAVTKFRLV